MCVCMCVCICKYNSECEQDEISRLERMNRIQWSQIKSHLGQLTTATFKSPPVMNTIDNVYILCVFSF